MNSEDYLKRQSLIESIVRAANETVNIEMTNNEHPEIVYSLGKLFQQRKNIALSYVNTSTESNREECLKLFSHVNEDIKRVIGL